MSDPTAHFWKADLFTSPSSTWTQARSHKSSKSSSASPKTSSASWRSRCCAASTTFTESWRWSTETSSPRTSCSTKKGKSRLRTSESPARSRRRWTVSRPGSAPWPTCRRKDSKAKDTTQILICGALALFFSNEL